MLALEGQVTAERTVQLLNADKGGVSGTFKRMVADGLMTLQADAKDGRLRHAEIKSKGRAARPDDPTGHGAGKGGASNLE